MLEAVLGASTAEVRLRRQHPSVTESGVSEWPATGSSLVQRGWSATGAAPLLTFALVLVGIVATGALNLRWTPAAAGLIAAVGIVVALGGEALWQGVNMVEAITRFGDAGPSVAGTLNGYADGRSVCPDAFHAMASLISQVRCGGAGRPGVHDRLPDRPRLAGADLGLRLRRPSPHSGSRRQGWSSFIPVPRCPPPFLRCVSWVNGGCRTGGESSRSAALVAGRRAGGVLRGWPRPIADQSVVERQVQVRGLGVPGPLRGAQWWLLHVTERAASPPRPRTKRGWSVSSADIEAFRTLRDVARGELVRNVDAGRCAAGVRRGTHVTGQAAATARSPDSDRWPRLSGLERAGSRSNRGTRRAGRRPVWGFEIFSG